VTTGILPIVEQYGKHSEAVWEGSKFWKQFFEASANVSLSGYEAPDQDESIAQEDTRESQLYDDETAEDEEMTGETSTPPRPSSAPEDDAESTLTFDSPSLGHSTPRAPPSTKGKGRNNGAGVKQPEFAGLSSPYETLKQEFQGLEGSKTPRLEPVTPGKSQALPDMTGQFDSSPFVQPTTGKKPYFNQDPLLHRVLDKTFRVQATPIISPRKYKPTGAFTPRTAQLQSSRDGLKTLRLHHPQRHNCVPTSSRRPRRRGLPVSACRHPQRVDSRLVSTEPILYLMTATKRRNMSKALARRRRFSFTFPRVNCSRRLVSPLFVRKDTESCANDLTAREASRRIVDDLLMTAGGDITDTTEGMDEDSPSVVRRQVDLDDSF
jgi:DASH complex subunit ASK1